MVTESIKQYASYIVTQRKDPVESKFSNDFSIEHPVIEQSGKLDFPSASDEISTSNDTLLEKSNLLDSKSTTVYKTLDSKSVNTSYKGLDSKFSDNYKGEESPIPNYQVSSVQINKTSDVSSLVNEGGTLTEKSAGVISVQKIPKTHKIQKVYTTIVF